MLVLWPYKTKYTILFFVHNSSLLNQSSEIYGILYKINADALNGQGKATWIRRILIKIDGNDVGKSGKNF